MPPEDLKRRIENLKSAESDYSASLSGFCDSTGSVVGLLAGSVSCFPQFRVEDIKPVFYKILEQINYAFHGQVVLTDHLIKDKLNQLSYHLVPLGSIAVGFGLGYLAGYFGGRYFFRKLYGEPQRGKEISRLEGIYDRLEKSSK